MYIARRQALGSPFLLRARVVGKGNPPTPSATIAENSRKVKAYQNLVHTRKLWEQSSNVDNRNAFKQVQPLRDVKSHKLEGDNWTLHDFEAPEKHLSNSIYVEVDYLRIRIHNLLHHTNNNIIQSTPHYAINSIHFYYHFSLM